MITLSTLRPTVKDPTGWTTVSALAQLKEAQKTRQHYDDLLQAAIAEYGDVEGTHTSGCYNPAFPEHIKEELRTLAQNIGRQVEYAYVLWHQTGRQPQTLRPYALDAYLLRDGRKSFY
jgi:hypothetical protein